MRPIVNVPEKDRTTDRGNMRKKLVKIARVVPEISCQTDTQTDALITIPRNRSRGRSNQLQDAAARLLCGASVRSHAPSFLKQLHWLPASSRIHFNL